MSVAKRIIPCLDVDKGRVVKGINFVDIVDAGDPVEIAKKYDREGADEITFLDITASHEGRDNIFGVVEQVANEVFIPLTVGGGVKSFSDVRDLLSAGADKVTINTAAVANPDLINEVTDKIGRQCDNEILCEISNKLSIPVIASGGAGSLQHLYDAISLGKADAVLAASIFHFGEYSISQAKDFLRDKGVFVR